MCITDENASLLLAVFNPALCPDTPSREPAEEESQGKAGALLSRASATGTSCQGTSKNVLLEPLTGDLAPGRLHSPGNCPQAPPA